MSILLAGHSAIEVLHVQKNAELEDRNMDTQDQSGELKFNRDLSWDLESEFARVQAMDLQQRLQMEQLQKERKVLDSVKKDLQRFQETLQTNGSSSSGATSSERPRESLLPPPLPPKKKAKSTQLKASKQKIKAQLMSTNASTDELDGIENAEVSKLEMEDDGNAKQLQLDEFGDQLPDDYHLESSFVNALEEESMGEGDAIDNLSVDHSEIATDTYPVFPDMIERNDAYPAFPDMIEEESDGYLSDSDVDTDAYSDTYTEAHQLSQTSLLDKMELLPKSAFEEENYADQIPTNYSTKSGDTSTREVYDSVKSGLTGSKQEQRTSTAHRTNTRGGGRLLATIDSWSHIDTSGLGSGTSSASRGMRGSALSRSQRGKRISSSELKGVNMIGDVSNNFEVFTHV